MECTVPLYLMISRTNTVIGKLIRVFCRCPYNHISLTTDPSLQNWYSFARYAQDVPLYGGFIREPAERFLASGEDIPVRIFRVGIPKSRAQKLEQLFSHAGKRDFKLLYNTLDAVFSSFGRQVSIPNAYTCLSFACTVLNLQFRSIRELNEYLSSYLIYEGSLSSFVQDSGCRKDAYFEKLGLLRGSRDTARHFSVLLNRIIRKPDDDLVLRHLECEPVTPPHAVI